MVNSELRRIADTLSYPVAELQELGFRCKIYFVSSGTVVKLNNTSFISSREHWLDMDLEDFSKPFGVDPDELEEWFDNVWTPKLYQKLFSTTNPMVQATVIPDANSTAHIISSFNNAANSARSLALSSPNLFKHP